MEGRRRSRTLKKHVYDVRKRLVAFALAAAMVFTNVGVDLNVSYAATSSESVTFEMTGSQLVAAIEEAIENDNAASPGDIDFTNGKIAEFESLFYGEGKVLEVFPEPEGGSMDAELRVFVRLPEDADDMYMVTGDEEVIFLYVNNGEDNISCSTNIIRLEDGAEKVKKTKRVTVESFESAFGDEEINYISKPVEEIAAPEETVGPGADETTAAPDESTTSADAQTPADEETSEKTTAADETTTAPQEGQTAAPEESGAGAPEESATEASAEAATTKEETAAPENNEEKTQDIEETEAPETERKEAEAPGAEKEAAEHEANAGEPVASITRHYAPIVADNEEGGAPEQPEAEAVEADVEEPEEKEKPAKEEKEPEKKETEAATEKETEAPAKDEPTTATDAKPSDITTATDAKPSDITTATDAKPSDTTTATKEESATASGNSESSADVPAEDVTAAPGTEDGTAAADQTTEAAETSPAETLPAETGKVPTGTSSEAAKTEDETKPAEETAKKAGTGDLVGIGYCITAKAYTTTVNALKALDDFSGYKVNYSINPEASARIVEGPRGVEEGQDVSFGVKTQIGFAINNVTVNGNALEANSVTDNDDGTQTAWYMVPEIYEEQEVEVYTIEIMEHPAFEAAVTINGVTVRVTAPEDVLPIGTELDVVEVTDVLEDAVKEKVESENESSLVKSVIAYDINLLFNGKKLDNSWAAQGYVKVEFSGERLVKESKDADQMKIICIETPTETVEAVSAFAEVNGEADAAAVAEVPVLNHVTANTISVEEVKGSESVAEVPGEATVDTLSFEAEHFTVYAIITESNKIASYSDPLQLCIGKSREIYCDKTGEGIEHNWKTGDEAIAAVIATGDGSRARIDAVHEGTTIISCGNHRSFELSVRDFPGAISTVDLDLSMENAHTIDVVPGTGGSNTCQDTGMHIPPERAGRSEHYVMVGQSGNHEFAITYVRCDLYNKLPKNPEKKDIYYVVYLDENEEFIESEFVKEGERPKDVSDDYGKWSIKQDNEWFIQNPKDFQVTEQNMRNYALPYGPKDTPAIIFKGVQDEEDQYRVYGTPDPRDENRKDFNKNCKINEVNGWVYSEKFDEDEDVEIVVKTNDGYVIDQIIFNL